MDGSRWKINFTKAASKSLAKISTKYLPLIEYAIKELEINPYAGDIKKLKGCNGLYRKRAGVYRIVYFIINDMLYIEIVDIDHRKDIYK